LGLAVGGALGGLLAQRYGADAVFLVCGLLTLVWLGFGLTMAPLQPRVKKQAA
jgi:predicted MFS family arabinose efflux permease